MKRRLDVRVPDTVARGVVSGGVANDGAEVTHAGSPDRHHGVRGGEQHLRRAPLRLAEKRIGGFVHLGSDARERAPGGAFQRLLRRLFPLESRRQSRRGAKRDGAIVRRVIPRDVVEGGAKAEREEMQRRSRLESGVFGHGRDEREVDASQAGC